VEQRDRIAAIEAHQTTSGRRGKMGDGMGKRKRATREAERRRCGSLETKAGGGASEENGGKAIASLSAETELLLSADKRDKDGVLGEDRVWIRLAAIADDHETGNGGGRKEE